MQFSRAAAILILGLPVLVAIPCVGEAPGRLRSETKLAGLQPGRDTLETAYKRFGKDTVDQGMSHLPALAAWRNPCTNQELAVTDDANGVIQELVVQPPLGASNVDCTRKSYSRAVRARFGTSRGLLFDDRCERIQEIYGPPESTIPSKVGGEQFLSYLYTFSADVVRLHFEATCKTATDQVDKLELSVAAN